MTPRPSKKIFVVIVVLILALLVFIAPFQNFVVKIFLAVSRPFLKWNTSNTAQTVILNCPTSTPPVGGAGVLSRPPLSPYDVLIIDLGSTGGVKAGMTVLASSNILLGYVTDVFPKTSKVKLISFPGEETSVVIEASSTMEKISALAVGRGNGEMEIRIPSAIEIHSGDQIITPGSSPLNLGAVEKTEINLSDPFQKIYFRLPINLQELQEVIVEK